MFPSRVVTAAVPVIAALLLVGCASKRIYRQPETAPAPARAETSPTVKEQPRTEPAPRPTTPAEAVEVGVRVATLAREQVGRPYRWGGDSPGEGFDCSGLVHWSYGCAGVPVPRVVREQLHAGQGITGDRLQPGDLVFFAMDRRNISHVGVYLGDGRFVHAPSSGQPVRIDSLADQWWRERWADSRRLLDG